jgi:hypothetical protein
MWEDVAAGYVQTKYLRRLHDGAADVGTKAIPV